MTRWPSTMLLASCSCWRSITRTIFTTASIPPEPLLKRRTLITHQRGIGIQQPANPERVLCRLLQRIRRPHLAPIDPKRGRELVLRPDVLQFPVLRLDYQQAAPGMKKMATPSSPKEGRPRNDLVGGRDPGFVLIVFEMGFQPPREAAFAGGHPAYYA